VVSPEGQHREGIEDQEVHWLEEERDGAGANHGGGHEEGRDDHRYHPRSGQPAKPPVQVEAIRGDEHVLHQVDRDPTHEQHGVEMDPHRRSKGRATHRQLERKAGDYDNGHDDRAAQKEALVPDRKRRRPFGQSRHWMSPWYSASRDFTLVVPLAPMSVLGGKRTLARRNSLDGRDQPRDSRDQLCRSERLLDNNTV